MACSSRFIAIDLDILLLRRGAGDDPALASSPKRTLRPLEFPCDFSRLLLFQALSFRAYCCLCLRFQNHQTARASIRAAMAAPTAPPAVAPAPDPPLDPEESLSGLSMQVFSPQESHERPLRTHCWSARQLHSGNVVQVTPSRHAYQINMPEYSKSKRLTVWHYLVQQQETRNCCLRKRSHEARVYEATAARLRE